METQRDNRLHDYHDAAHYCDLKEDYFGNLHREGRGPEFVKPSPRRVFFTTRALDTWMASWTVVAR